VSVTQGDFVQGLGVPLRAWGCALQVSCRLPCWLSVRHSWAGGFAFDGSECFPEELQINASTFKLSCDWQ